MPGHYICCGLLLVLMIVWKLKKSEVESLMACLCLLVPDATRNVRHSLECIVHFNLQEFHLLVYYYYTEIEWVMYLATCIYVY